MSLRKRRKFNIPILMTTGVLGGGGSVSPYIYSENFGNGKGGWTTTQLPDDNTSVVSGELRLTHKSNGQGAKSPTITVENGASYTVTVDMRSSSTGVTLCASCIMVTGTTSPGGIGSSAVSGGTAADVTANGVTQTKTFTFTATGTTATILFFALDPSVSWANVGQHAYIDNITVEKIVP